MRRRFPQLMRRKGSRWTAGATAFQPSQVASYTYDWDSRYDVLEATSDPAEDTDPVSEWIDQASGISLLQASAPIRPTWDESGGPGGLPAVDFAPSGSYMDSSGISALAQPFTVYAVARRPSAATQTLYDGVTNRCILFRSGAQWVIYGGSASLLNTGLPAVDTWFLDEAVLNGASSSHRLDGGSKVTGANPGTGSWGEIRLGNNNPLTTPWNGKVARLLVFNDTLSAGDETAVRTYLASLYGVTV